jgi:hypothetical protein
MGSNRLQMRTSNHHADLRTRGGELDCEQTTNGPRPHNADFHAVTRSFEASAENTNPAASCGCRLSSTPFATRLGVLHSRRTPARREDARLPIPASPSTGLRLPVIGSPLFIISNPDLVLAQCKAGVIGSFPAFNARPATLVDEWLHRITREPACAARSSPRA